MASTAAVPQQRISGRCAARLSVSFPFSSAGTTAAASGRTRIAGARPIGSDTGGLLGGRGGLTAGGGERGNRLLGLGLRQRLGVERRRHADLAQVLPVG